MRQRPIVAIDLGGTNIRIGLVDRNGRILRRRRTGMQPVTDGDALFEMLAELIRSFIAGGKGLPRPKAVAIGFAGLTMAARGYVYFAPNIGKLSHLELGPRVGALIGMPVYVENDANCAALGEYWRGAGQGADSLFLFTLGTGVGGGFVLEGRLWDGHAGIAGEIGHTIVDLKGPRCACGNRGCLEALASATAIVREYKRVTRRRKGGGAETVSAKTVVGRAREGERAAKQVVSSAAIALGTGIANVYHLMNPQLILIGGGVSRAGSILIDPAIRRARETVLAPIRDGIKVKRARLGDDAGLLGAAYLAYTAE